jgi:hypothetical protein
MRLYLLFIVSNTLLYMFRASLAHLQECTKLCFAAYVTNMLLCVVRLYYFRLMSSSISSRFLVVGVRGLVPLGGIFGFCACIFGS